MLFEYDGGDWEGLCKIMKKRVREPGCPIKRINFRQLSGSLDFQTKKGGRYSTNGVGSILPFSSRLCRKKRLDEYTPGPYGSCKDCRERQSER